MSTQLEIKYQYCQKAIAIKHQVEGNFMQLAEALYNIKTKGLWEEAYSSWDEFRDEIKLSDATISKLMKIYALFVVEYGFTTKQLSDAGGWSVLAETMPLIGSRSDAEAWLHKSTTLSLRDIRKEVLEAKLGVSATTECKHSNSYVIRVCPDCGTRERLYTCSMCSDPL